jgi:hypothetical protein
MSPLSARRPKVAKNQGVCFDPMEGLVLPNLKNDAAHYPIRAARAPRRMLDYIGNNGCS